MSSDNSLSSNSSNSTHGQSSIQKLLHLHILHLGSILGSLVSESKVTGISLSLHCSLDGGNGNNGIEQTNEQKELVHGSLQKNVVGVDRLGDGLEAVGISGDTDEVGSDESDNGEHGGTAVTELGFTEEGNEGAVGFGETEGVEFEGASLEVLSSDCFVIDSCWLDYFKERERTSNNDDELILMHNLNFAKNGPQNLNSL